MTMKILQQDWVVAASLYAGLASVESDKSQCRGMCRIEQKDVFFKYENLIIKLGLNFDAFVLIILQLFAAMLVLFVALYLEA